MRTLDANLSTRAIMEFLKAVPAVMGRLVVCNIVIITKLNNTETTTTFILKVK
jgi:hypothetical protein